MILHQFLEKVGRDQFLTACGRTVRSTDIAISGPTCPACLEWLNDDRTAEDVFGSEAEIRQYGPVVKARWPNDAA